MIRTAKVFYKGSFMILFLMLVIFLCLLLPMAANEKSSLADQEGSQNNSPHQDSDVALIDYTHSQPGSNEVRDSVKQTKSPAVDGVEASTNANADSSADLDYREGYKRLWKDLRDREVVRLKIPPKFSNITPMNLYYTPYQLIHVQDYTQIVTVKITFSVEWNDSELTWRPEDYAGIEEVQIPSWTPFVVIPEAVRQDHLAVPDLVWVNYTGVVGVTDAFTIDVFCYLDMEYFPFDEHECTLTVYISGGFMPFIQKADEGKITSTIGEWRINSSGCEVIDAKEVYGSMGVSCSIKIQRQSIFYVANVIVPMVVTSILTCMVFLIPVESGEKISFLLNIYISTSVFLNFIVHFLPKSMTKIPRLNILLLCQVIEIILATLLTLVVMARYKAELRKQKKNAIARQGIWLDYVSFLTEIKSKLCEEEEDSDEEAHAVSRGDGNPTDTVAAIVLRPLYWLKIIKKICAGERLTHVEVDFLCLVIFSLMTFSTTMILLLT